MAATTAEKTLDWVEQAMPYLPVEKREQLARLSANILQATSNLVAAILNGDEAAIMDLQNGPNSLGDRLHHLREQVTAARHNAPKTPG